MSVRPRYHIFILAASCLLASCSADEPEATPANAVMEFSVAPEARSEQMILSPFTVYGDMKNIDTNAHHTVFNNVPVTYNQSTTRYEYSGTQYWFPYHEYSFVAIYPSDVLSISGANALYDNSQLSFTYTLPPDHTQTTDILTATHRRQYISGTTTPVNLRFYHLMSQINFSLELNETSMTGDECVKIHKLEIAGFGTSATINIKPAPRQSGNQTDDSEINIATDQEGNGRLAIDFAEPLTVTRAASVKMFDGNNAIILLPQTFAANEKVQIRLTYSVNDEPEETQVSATLSNFTWESGKSYIYKIKLELDEAKEANMVISNATITPWILIDGHDEVEAI